MTTRSLLIAALLLVSTACWTSTAHAAFHTGGVGSCGGCHVGHDTDGTVSPKLLASDPGSVCLTCHTGPGGPLLASVFSFDGSAFTPGGDFYWLTKTFTWIDGTSPGETHGHNVIAVDFGLTADPLRLSAPGGTFPSSQLTCTSCHDPHGKSRGTGSASSPISVSGSYGQVSAADAATGSYRLLGGVGYTVDGYTFTEPPPVARQNGALPFGESDASHVDYGSGMSEWCANCHATLLTGGHLSGSGTFSHPSGGAAVLPLDVVSTYNSYVSTGDMTGTVDSAYLQFVPFERGVATPGLLDPISTRGPDGSANVSCLTCHRAHASAFRFAGRWDFDATLLVNSHPAVGDGGVSGNDVANSYYGRDIALEFGASQGPFCEKCHAGSAP